MKTRSGREIKSPGWLQEYETPVEAMVRVCDPESFRGERPDTDWMWFAVAWADVKQVNGELRLGNRKMYFLSDVIDKVIQDGHLVKTIHMYKMLQFLRGATSITLDKLIDKMGSKTLYVIHNAESDMKALKSTCQYMGIEFPSHLRYRCTRKFIDEKYYSSLVKDYEDENTVPFVSTKLETMYKWVTNNPKFVQSHMGDEDVILLYKSLEKISKRIDSDVLKKIASDPS